MGEKESPVEPDELEDIGDEQPEFREIEAERIVNNMAAYNEFYREHRSEHLTSDE